MIDVVAHTTNLRTTFTNKMNEMPNRNDSMRCHVHVDLKLHVDDLVCTAK